MKTVLPTSISSIEEAKGFLLSLVENNEAYNDENAFGLEWAALKASAIEHANVVRLMAQIYSLKEVAVFRSNHAGYQLLIS